MDRLRKLKNQKGFTLVELMVVVVIIGILVAIAIPIFNNVQENAANKAHAANIRTLMGAGQMAVAGGGGIPAAEVVWTGLSTGTNNAAPHLASDYIKDWPSVPAGATTNPDGTAIAATPAYTVTISIAGAVTVGGF